MADEGKARPVSGEIMAGAREAARNARASGGDVIDAEYEIISAPPLQPETLPPDIASPAVPLGGMGMLRPTEEERPAPLSKRGGPSFWAFGVVLAAMAFWVSGGHSIVRNAAFLASQTPLSALSIADVTSRVDTSGPQPVLFVEGQTANDGSAEQTQPPLEITVTANDGAKTRYRLGTSGRRMAPGERFSFSSRLAVPKNGVKTVTVNFTE